jgi:DNA damage-binding protein 1
MTREFEGFVKLAVLLTACISLDTHILVSTLQDTHLFQIDSGSTISRVESAAKGFISNLPTLAVSNIARRIVKGKQSTYVNSSLVVQVTPRGAFLLEFNIATREFTQLAGWELLEEGVKSNAKPLEIVAASVNPSQVVLALTGGRLITLTVTELDQFREVV